jgi:RNA polymerase primary sigma factor
MTHTAADGASTFFAKGLTGPLLTAEEERRLGEAAHHGDRDARDRLVLANLRLVVSIARSFAGRGLPPNDLVGEGNLGLIRAATDYDPRFGTRFSTYAGHWIKQAIRHALINTTATIRLPAHMVKLVTEYRRAERALTKEEGCPPTDDKVAARLGLTDSRRSMLDKALASLRPRSEGGVKDGRAWLTNELEAGSETPGAGMEADEERQDLLRRLSGLGTREQDILTLRYGLGGEPPLTLKEVGLRVGVTREWVRKLEAKSLARLDDALAGESGAEPVRAVPGRYGEGPGRSRALPSWDQVKKAAHGLVLNP